MAMQQMEQRVSRLEGAYEQVNERLNDLTQAVTSLRGDFNSLRTELSSFRNAVFIALSGMWLSVMGAVVGLYLTR